MARRARRVESRSAAGPGRHLAATPDAGRVDEHDLAAAPLEPRIDRVPRRARHLRDDDALLAEEGVEQARLADIRSPDQGDRGRSLVGRRDLGVPASGGRVDEVQVIVRPGLACLAVPRLILDDAGSARDDPSAMSSAQTSASACARLARQLLGALRRQVPDQHVEQIGDAPAVDWPRSGGSAPSRADGTRPPRAPASRCRPCSPPRGPACPGRRSSSAASCRRVSDQSRRVDDEDDEVRLGDGQSGLVLDPLSMSSSGTTSRPPVSTTTNRRPFHSASP